MSVLWITVPATLALALVLLALVLREVMSGGFDDLEGPGRQIVDDDDAVPERDGAAESGISARRADAADRNW